MPVDDALGEIFSLYYDVPENERVDLEVFARASIELSRAAKEIAYILSPDAILSVELDGTENGSLFKNLRLKILGKDTESQKATTRIVAAALAVWLIGQVPGYTLGKAFDYVIERLFPKEQGLSRAEVEKLINEALRNQNVKEGMERTLIEIQKDNKVRSIGPATTPNKKPDVVIRREDFEKIITGSDVVQENIIKRRTKERRELTLISPYLVASPRSWRFHSKDGPISAKMKDEMFLKSLMLGEIDMRMTEGIILDVLLETDEEFIDGAWVTKKRSVLTVYSAKRGPEQLVFGPFG